jgi:arsenite-transporting ATPase
LADAGRRVLLVSTDPASNLDDVLGMPVGPEPTTVPDVTGLAVMNLDPDAAADAYRRRVIEPYRGTISGEELRAIEEQLAGECSVEVAAFDQFTQLIVHPELSGRYDHVLFDTAPTGHTLRLLNLPTAWSQYIDTSADGASCLGPRSGLRAQREQYHAAVEQLRDSNRTTLVLVGRPEPGALREAARTGGELAALGVGNQRLVINALFATPLAGDPLAEAFAHRQQLALRDMPAGLRALPGAAVELTALNLTGVAALRALATDRCDVAPVLDAAVADEPDLPGLDALVKDLAAGGPGAVLVMGKGGVGKTTIAAGRHRGLPHPALAGVEHERGLG